jgi:hypothetical protein
MRFVLALSNPSRTKMRAVASRSACTVIRDRCCEADFRGLVRTILAICLLPPECEYRKRVIARILFRVETPDKRISTMNDTLQNLIQIVVQSFIRVLG